MNHRQTIRKYNTHGGAPEYVPSSGLLDQELNEKLLKDIKPPQVTGQLLDLNKISMSVLEQGTISLLQADGNEQVICAVAGELTVHMITGWQRYEVYAGEPFKNGEPMSSNQSRLDITEGLGGARTHEMTLAKGDCVYIPAFWWY